MARFLLPQSRQQNAQRHNPDRNPEQEVFGFFYCPGQASLIHGCLLGSHARKKCKWLTKDKPFNLNGLTRRAVRQFASTRTHSVSAKTQEIRPSGHLIIGATVTRVTLYAPAGCKLSGSMGLERPDGPMVRSPDGPISISFPESPAIWRRAS